jgi:hypothetical protein
VFCAGNDGEVAESHNLGHVFRGIQGRVDRPFNTWIN